MSKKTSSVSPVRGVEMARFGKKHIVMVNHRSSPVNIHGIAARNVVSQIPSEHGWLAAHSAMCLEL
jgi:hypothetical protein